MSVKVKILKTGKTTEIAKWLYDRNPSLYEVIKPKAKRKPKAEKRVVAVSEPLTSEEAEMAINAIQNRTGEANA